MVEVDAGLHAGASYSGIFGVGCPKIYQPRTFGTFGGFLDFRIATAGYFHIEANYFQRGFAYTEPIPAVDGAFLSVAERNNYLSIPTVFKFKSQGEFMKVHFSAGIETSFLFYRHLISSATIRGLNFDTDSYYKHIVKFYDYGLHFTAGFQLGSIILEAGYYNSLTNMFTNEYPRDMHYYTYFARVGIQLNYSEDRGFRPRKGWRAFKYKLKMLFR